MGSGFTVLFLSFLVTLQKGKLFWVVEPKVDIPPFIGIEIRCYDEPFYMFLKRPFYLQAGERFEYLYTYGGAGSV